MSKLPVLALAEGNLTVNGEKRHAERLILDSLSEEQLRWLNGFVNVKISECAYRYAPEITHPVVYLIG